MPVKLGDTIKSDHLYVICTAPLNNGSVLAFNLTTCDWDSDQTCVIEVGEHPYVRRRSVIAYKYGELLTPIRIERLQLLAPQDYGPVSEALLQRIQKRALSSRETPDKLKTMMRDYLTRARANRRGPSAND